MRYLLCIAAMLSLSVVAYGDEITVRVSGYRVAGPNGYLVEVPDEHFAVRGSCNTVERSFQALKHLIAARNSALANAIDGAGRTPVFVSRYGYYPSAAAGAYRIDGCGYIWMLDPYTNTWIKP